MTETLTLPPPAPRPSRKGAFAALGVAAALAALIWWAYAGRTVESVEATVGGRVYVFAAPASGRVLAAPVAEGQDVRRGELVLALDDVPLRAALAEAQAALRLAERGGVPASPSPGDREAERNARITADERREAEQAARRVLEHWSAEHARSMVALRVPGAASGPGWNDLVAQEAQNRARMDDARRALDDASRQRADADALLRNLARLRAADRPGPELVALWQTRVAQAEEALASAKFFAPEDARLIRLDAREGQNVAQGEELAVLAPPAGSSGTGSSGAGNAGTANALWVDATFAAEDAARLREGQACRVTLPDGDGLTLNGSISALTPGAAGEALARIRLDAAGSGQAIYPGQRASVRVRV